MLTFLILELLSSSCKVRVPMLGELSSSVPVFKKKMIKPVNDLTHENASNVQ